MSLAAIPEDIPLQQGSGTNGVGQVQSSSSNQVTMSVKHTFIEVSVPPRTTQRMRSFTDSELLTSGVEDDGRPRAPEPGSDASTDAPSDVEEVAEAQRFAEFKSPSLEAQRFADYKSQQWGPAGDLHYSGTTLDPLGTTMEAFPLLPSSDYFPSEEYQSWNGMPDDGSWMLPWAAAQYDASQFDQQWQLYEADPSVTAGYEPSMHSSVSTSMVNAGASYDSAVLASPPADQPMTTVMLRNLPDHFTRSHVMELLEDEGFEGSYDLVYAPMDFGAKCCLGYAFVNFLAESDAARCWTVFDGFSEWGTPCDKKCEVMWSQPHQGVEVLIERYRNSPVMHESVPDEWKPAYFIDGVQVEFPQPTKKIKAPQMKARNKKTKSSTDARSDI